jgi:hypothetical protein
MPAMLTTRTRHFRRVLEGSRLCCLFSQLPAMQTMQMSDAFVEHAVRCSLIDYLDKSLMVILRDGKKFVGTLRLLHCGPLCACLTTTCHCSCYRTFDQYSNIVLEETVERKGALIATVVHR